MFILALFPIKVRVGRSNTDVFFIIFKKMLDLRVIKLCKLTLALIFKNFITNYCVTVHFHVTHTAIVAFSLRRWLHKID